MQPLKFQISNLIMAWLSLDESYSDGRSAYGDGHSGLLTVIFAAGRSFWPA
jgi:hypothetical protein